MSIRHDKCDLLERLLKENGGSGLAIHVEHKVTGLPSVDFYHSLDALMTQKKKIQPSTIKLNCGQPMPIYITNLPEDKFVTLLLVRSMHSSLCRSLFRLPKVIHSFAGTFLRGSMTFALNEQMKKLVCIACALVLFHIDCFFVGNDANPSVLH